MVLAFSALVSFLSVVGHFAAQNDRFSRTKIDLQSIKNQDLAKLLDRLHPCAVNAQISVPVLFWVGAEQSSKRILQDFDQKVMHVALQRMKSPRAVVKFVTCFRGEKRDAKDLTISEKFEGNGQFLAMLESGINATFTYAIIQQLPYRAYLCVHKTLAQRGITEHHYLPLAYEQCPKVDEWRSIVDGYKDFVERLKSGEIARVGPSVPQGAN